MGTKRGESIEVKSEMSIQEQNIEHAKQFGALMGKMDKARDEIKKRFIFIAALQILTLIMLILTALPSL